MIIGSKAIGTVAYLGGLPAVLEQFCWSWGQMAAFNAEWCDEGVHIHLERSAFSDHAPARNALVSRFVGDWLVQLDTDHVFEPDIVARMVMIANKHDLDVVSGLYQMKQPPHVPVLFQWVGPEDAPGLQPMAVWPDNVKVVQIGSAGGGCLFVRRRVFDRIATELNEQPFDKIFPYSEDHSFFLRLKRLNIEAYAALNVHCHHLRISPVTLDDLPQNGKLQQSELFEVKGYG
jgi:hypothetical protein